MSSLLVLETEDFTVAARTLRLSVAEPLEAGLAALSSVLQGGGGMAGSDPAGVEWAATYDRAARSAFEAAAMATQALDRVAMMFAQTARNYEAADAASTAGARRAIEQAIAVLPSFGPVCLTPPPSAAGGSGGEPAGWGLISHLVGYVWPNGHQDELRRAAAAWNVSAEALRQGATETRDAAWIAASDRLPEAADMQTVCHSLAQQLEELGDAHRALGAACEGLAQHLDEVHSAVERELTSLIEWTTAIEVTGGFLSVLTFGLAEAPTQGIEAARVGATAARVGQLIERFVVASRAVAAPVGVAADRVVEVTARLRVVVETRLNQAAVTIVGRFRMLDWADDTGAIGRISSEAGDNLRLFAERDDARKGLTGVLLQRCNKFFKGATGKARDFKIFEIDDGYRLEFFSPADNEGYGKLYVLILGNDGEAIEEFKDTIGPDGFINRKWVPRS